MQNPGLFSNEWAHPQRRLLMAASPQPPHPPTL